jgi:hypothetical protein
MAKTGKRGILLPDVDILSGDVRGERGCQISDVRCQIWALCLFREVFPAVSPQCCASNNEGRCGCRVLLMKKASSTQSVINDFPSLAFFATIFCLFFAIVCCYRQR